MKTTDLKSPNPVLLNDHQTCIFFGRNNNKKTPHLMYIKHSGSSGEVCWTSLDRVLPVQAVCLARSLVDSWQQECQPFAIKTTETKQINA